MRECQEQNVDCKASILQKAMDIQCGNYLQNLDDQKFEGRVTKVSMIPRVEHLQEIIFKALEICLHALKEMISTKELE